MAVAVLGALMTPQLRLSPMDGEMEHLLLITWKGSWLIFREEGWGKEFVLSLLACDFFSLRIASENLPEGLSYLNRHFRDPPLLRWLSGSLGVFFFFLFNYF